MQEVENAMALYLSALKQVDALAEVVKQAKEAFDLSFDIYKTGLTQFNNVADAQISFLQYADSLVVARGNALSALINLYQALGGGWTES